MENAKKYSEFFLGANRPGGFCSLFENVYKEKEDWQIYVIKGGPGSGKSTLMRSVAQRSEQLGEYAERIYCSSAPSSLDAVILPKRRCAVFDATAPHVIEPTMPGARENIVNLGDCWNSGQLYAERHRIAELSSKCSSCHKSAQRLLCCADAFRRNTSELAAAAMNREKILAQARRLVKKYVSAQRGVGEVELRLLSAVTPKGVVLHSDTVSSACSTVVPISDELYAPAEELMRRLLFLLGERCSCTNCVCSQELTRTEHIIIPTLSLAISVQNSFHAVPATERAVRTERFMPPGFLREHRKRIRENRRLCKMFTEAAAQEMACAKTLHDELESCYIAAMDFSAVEDLTRRTVGRIFS